MHVPPLRTTSLHVFFCFLLFSLNGILEITPCQLAELSPLQQRGVDGPCLFSSFLLCGRLDDSRRLLMAACRWQPAAGSAAAPAHCGCTGGGGCGGLWGAVLGRGRAGVAGSMVRRCRGLLGPALLPPQKGCAWWQASATRVCGPASPPLQDAVRA